MYYSSIRIIERYFDSPDKPLVTFNRTYLALPFFFFHRFLNGEHVTRLCQNNIRIYHLYLNSSPQLFPSIPINLLQEISLFFIPID